MKAILIDVENQEVREVEIGRGLKPVYEVMGVRSIETATYLPNGDVIYCDEEGLFGLNDKSMFFDVNAHQPFVGNGLVVGTSRDGDSISCQSTVEEIKKLVTFKTMRQIEREVVESVGALI